MIRWERLIMIRWVRLSTFRWLPDGTLQDNFRDALFFGPKPIYQPSTRSATSGPVPDPGYWHDIAAMSLMRTRKVGFGPKSAGRSSPQHPPSPTSGRKVS
jgi:hypothetical protein